MANIIQIDGKDIKDVVAREGISELKTSIQDVLVYSSDVDTVTVTNGENTQDFHEHTLEISGFYKPISLANGVLSAVNSGTSTEASPYIIDKTGWGEKKWICGFKYKLTKLDPNVANPEMIRIHLGTTVYDSNVVWGEWVDFSKTVELNLTRIRFATRNFPSAPAADSFKVEIKDMYLYDGTDISADMCAYIMAQQSSNYQDGTVTYTTGEEGYFPDVSLQTAGKAADSKAVGDAIGAVKLDVTKFGVAGDGTTDDTDAINALLTQPGIFYFPTGTYKISGTISVPANSIICGDGDTSIIDMYNCDDLTECTFRGSDKVYPYILIANDNCAIKNIKIVGNNTLQQKRHAGIGVLDADRCVIDDVTIYNINYDATQDLDATVSGYGICVTRSNYVNVERCNVVQCGYECIGIVDDCNHCVVRDCYTQDGWRTCIQVHRGSSNTLIENCYGKQTHTKYDSCFTVHGQDEQPVSNLRVENCTFECTQNGAQPLDYCAPMQIMSYAEYPVFIGNRVFGGKRAFFINQSSTNAKIIGNDFQCNSDSDYGVTIGSLSSIAIGNCLVNEASTPVNAISNNPVLSGNIGIAE